MFNKTVNEIILEEKLARALDELQYLRRNLEGPGERMEYLGDNIYETDKYIVPAQHLDRIAFVQTRPDDFNLCVIASGAYASTKQVEVSYYAPKELEFGNEYIINSILPRLHEEFLNRLRSVLTEK